MEAGNCLAAGLVRNIGFSPRGNRDAGNKDNQNHQAPRPTQAFLLLSIMALISQGQITRNFMEWDMWMKGGGSFLELYAVLC